MKNILLACLALLLAACGNFQTVNQTEETTYLQLLGNKENAVLTLDTNTTVDLNTMESFDLNGKNATRIVVPAGQHRITITRSGTVLVDRNVYIGEGNAFEITLP
ncbi:MAG TPA: hypothetical protein VM553_05695 [Dongiaceae bacterium]|nr:hypothetical protein [Dongiaceae bacterium]